MVFENIEVSSSLSITGSFVIPIGPSSSRPSGDKLQTGSLFWNTDSNSPESYNGTVWQTISTNTSSVPPDSADIEYLVIAGGGGGAGSDTSGEGAGGGGAGGYLSSSLASVESGSSFTITVGAGGSVGTNSPRTAGGDGGDSSIAGTSISTITAIGGGGGGFDSGRDGGSGGGTPYTSGYGLTPGSGTVGQGHDGGYGSSSNRGGTSGGGGGAGEAAGTDGVGHGGDGLASSITGTSITRAGGGAGGNSGTAGDGGGGTSPSGNGTANTGGGAGGGASNTSGGSGGSGVVILAYPSSSISANGGTKSTRSDGHVVHTFNSSGTFIVGARGDYIIPNQHFGVVTYSGENKSITGVGFEPDLVWIKKRDQNIQDHVLFDSLRGATKRLYPDLTNAEQTNSDTLTSFDSDGFTIGGNDTVGSTGNYVAWCLKAGGAAVSGTSTFFTNTEISANPSAGFSIVNFTVPSGTWSTDASYNHGLNSAPKLVITKAYSGAGAAANWFTYSEAVGTSKYLKLNSNDPETSGAIFSTVDATKVKYRFASSYGSSTEVVTYNFTDIDGYQKVGSYTGDGTTSKSITTGFEPRFLMIKVTSGADNWVIFDNARDTSNPRNTNLKPNSNAIEADEAGAQVNFTSTGFTCIGSGAGIGQVNSNNATYIYLAIA